MYLLERQPMPHKSGYVQILAVDDGGIRLLKPSAAMRRLEAHLFLAPVFGAFSVFAGNAQRQEWIIGNVRRPSVFIGL